MCVTLRWGAQMSIIVLWTEGGNSHQVFEMMFCTVAYTREWLELIVSAVQAFPDFFLSIYRQASV